MNLLLGVNIDHVATLRQARYALNPDALMVEPCVIEAAHEAQKGGADSITIHVREDKRHMQPEDAFLIRKEIDLPLNLEMANTSSMVEFACQLGPDFVCLVPESREEVTTEGGLDVMAHFDQLKISVTRLQGAGIRVSLFIDPDEEQIKASAELGVEMIEIHTGAFALSEGESYQRELQRISAGAELGHSLDLQVNAGHGIHLKNVIDIISVKNLTELNIGHHLISRSVTVGLRAAVAEMKELMTTDPVSVGGKP